MKFDRKQMCMIGVKGEGAFDIMPVLLITMCAELRPKSHRKVS
jgi:hypothetical protein